MILICQYWTVCQFAGKVFKFTGGAYQSVGCRWVEITSFGSSSSSLLISCRSYVYCITCSSFNPSVQSSSPCSSMSLFTSSSSTSRLIVFPRDIITLVLFLVFVSGSNPSKSLFATAAGHNLSHAKLKVLLVTSCHAKSITCKQITML